MTAALLVAAALAAAAPAQAAGGLHLAPPPTAAGERLMGFELHVRNGRVSALPDWPPGWTVSVDNDPAWRATVKAHAAVGAAALAPAALGRLVELAAPPRVVTADLGAGPVAVSGSIELMQGGEVRTVTLRSIQVRPAGVR